jgi:hypothetical protein
MHDTDEVMRHLADVHNVHGVLTWDLNTRLATLALAA